MPSFLLARAVSLVPDCLPILSIRENTTALFKREMSCPETIEQSCFEGALTLGATAITASAVVFAGMIARTEEKRINNGQHNFHPS